MVTGFTFMGMHSSDLGVYYAPDAGTMFDDREDIDIYEDDVEWRDGGLYYGMKAKPKEFSLSCFFEDLPERQYQRMKQWLDAGNQGKLIFDDAPWKYYDVVLTKKTSGKTYLHRNEASGQKEYSGTMTITMTAYAPPFAHMTCKAINADAPEGITDVCNILKAEEMPPAPAVDDRDFLVYNCGIVTTPCVMRIGGTVDENGMTIVNETTGQKCRLTSLPPSPAYLEIDSGKGSVKVVDPSTASKMIAFEYHDLGYISLAPNSLLDDTVRIAHTAGSNTVALTDGDAPERFVGRYIRLGDQWMRIIHVSGNNMVLNTSVATSGTSDVTPVVMNRISIDGIATLDRLEIDWEPLVR